MHQYITKCVSFYVHRKRHGRVHTKTMTMITPREYNGQGGGDIEDFYFLLEWTNCSVFKNPLLKYRSLWEGLFHAEVQ